VEAIAQPIIDHYVREYFAEDLDRDAKEKVERAIDGERANFDKLIEAHRDAIQRAQAEGREVAIQVALDMNWQDTEIGNVLMSSRVGRVLLVFEDGATPPSYIREKRGGFLGDALRMYTGTDLTAEMLTIPLEGTDPEARRQRGARKEIDAALRPPVGPPSTSFEKLVVDGLEGRRSLDDLSDYAAHRFDEATMALEAGIPPSVTGLSYWAGMQTMLDGTLDGAIAAAKAKGVALDDLRAVAVRKRDLAGQSSDAGAGPATAAYWSEVIRLIDAP
jgi:hypothetical protein